MKQKVYHYEPFTHLSCSEDEINNLLTGNVEIFKNIEDPDTAFPLTDIESQILHGLVHAEIFNRADGIYAVDLKANDFYFASGLVDILNESHQYNVWCVGDPAEEYVYIE